MSEQDANQTIPQRPRRRAPVPLAQNVMSVLRQHLKSRGFAQIELVTRWAEIAGSALADHCFPFKLSAPTSSGVTLTLVADDRAALELQHQTPKVIDKINAYFGKQVVTRIKVITGTMAPAPKAPPPPRRLSEAEELELEAWTSGVESPDLRQALTRLGRNALVESRKTAVLKR